MIGLIDENDAGAFNPSSDAIEAEGHSAAEEDGVSAIDSGDLSGAETTRDSADREAGLGNIAEDGTTDKGRSDAEWDAILSADEDEVPSVSGRDVAADDTIDEDDSEEDSDEDEDEDE